MDYQQFISKKSVRHRPAGFAPGPVNDILFDWQQHTVKTCIERGSSAIFAECGLGKTFMQLEFGRQVNEHASAPVMILAPLGVAHQTVREGAKLGLDVTYCRDQADVTNGINVTNYERLQKFDFSIFAGVIPDESSILKSYAGTTKRRLVEIFKYTPYKCCCTATPSPNDHMEILNQAAFLGVMEANEALSIWFINDTTQMGTYRLKKHAVNDFWEWVCSWAVCITKPSDLGDYSDDGFILPPLNEQLHTVAVDATPSTGLFHLPDLSATGFHKEKRRTAPARARLTAEIVSGISGPVMVWCDTNYEADLLRDLIPTAVEVRGQDKPETKERATLDFLDGNIRVLIAKPEMFGYGLNFQHCADTVFCGLDFSFESYYQAVRRFWRFGQPNPVNVHVVLGEGERQILEVVQRKRADHEEMQRQMSAAVRRIQAGQQTRLQIYNPTKRMVLPQWLRSVC